MLCAVRPATAASAIRSRNGANFDPGDERNGAVAPASIFLIARLTVLRSSCIRRAISRRGTPSSRHRRMVSKSSKGITSHLMVTGDRPVAVGP